MREEDWIKAANAETPQAGGGWDSPSGEVWAGIQAALQQRRRRRMLFWWWLGAGVTALALLAWVLHRPEPGIVATLSDQKSSTVQAPPEESIRLSDSQSNVANLSFKERRMFTKLPKFSKHRTLKLTTLDSQTVSILPDYPAVRLSASEQATELPKKTPVLLENPPPAIPAVTNSVIRTPRWWAGISGAYPLQADLLAGQSEIPAYAVLQEKLSRRRDWSARLGLDHRKWRFYTGVGMYNLDLRTQLSTRLLYDPQLERPASDNTVESTYAFSMPSGYGRIDCEVDFFRSSDRPVTPGRAVPVRIENRQQLQMIQVPLGINYRLARWGAFSARVGGGLSANWIVDRDMEINAASRLEGLNLRRVRRLASSGNRVEPAT
ncbi:MAG: hypothetical protein IPN33_03390 [Saprospiraceae bacterium]|nr:hypothetical protein [Saprospiraceae bacterium]